MGFILVTRRRIRPARKALEIDESARGAAAAAAAAGSSAYGLSNSGSTAEINAIVSETQMNSGSTL